MIDNILNTILKKRPYDKLNLSNRLEVNYEKEWVAGLSNKFTFTWNQVFQCSGCPVLWLLQGILSRPSPTAK